MAALDPIFKFDRIFCFEPVPQCVEIIRRIRDRRIVLVQACLSKSGGEVSLFNPGTLAASVYEDAPEYGATTPPLTVTAINAGDFFAAFLRPEDRVWMKLNCEGSECDIIESIIDSNQHTKIKNTLIDYDALKIPSQRNRVADVQRRVIESRDSTFLSSRSSIRNGNELWWCEELAYRVWWVRDWLCACN